MESSQSLMLSCWRVVNQVDALHVLSSICMSCQKAIKLLHAAGMES